MKTCTRCEQLKPLTEFDPTRRKPDQLKSLCRPCCRAVSREVAAANRKQREQNATGTTYASRNANLKRLGFDSYKDYLASETWRAIRRKVYAAKGGSCHLCGERATELHHNRYHTNDLSGKCIRFINPICRVCHKGIEFRDEQKATLKQAAKAFRRRRKQQQSSSSGADHDDAGGA